jgi:uncharacterized protein (TIGR03085 family)
MARYAQAERQSLADLLLSLGPDAPTLDEGWHTRDLAAHVVVRDRRPDAVAGIVLRDLRVLHEHSERVRAELARTPYPGLVGLVRQPPWWSPMSNPLLDGVTNTTEFFIHHEDVRRAQEGWQPRDLPREHEAALWRQVRPLGRLALRKLRATVLMQAPGFGEIRAGGEGPEVRLVGAPGELLMFVSGRQRAARVQLDGPPDAVEMLRTQRLGV